MSTPRIVLDSNVVISAFLFGGVPARLLELALDGSIECFTSLQILDEIRDVLMRPKFGLSSDQALTLIEELHDLCQVVSPEERVLAVVDDPDDNIILECASTADADFIVSGDSHLLHLRNWRDIHILAPSDFMKIMEDQQIT